MTGFQCDTIIVHLKQNQSPPCPSLGSESNGASTLNTQLFVKLLCAHWIITTMKLLT